MRTIVLINGVARSGKDTFADYLKSHLETHDGFSPIIIPNAQTVKIIASKVYGWDNNKDERGRSLLIDITNTGYKYDKYFWEKNSLHHLAQMEGLTKTNYNFMLVPDFRYKNTYDFYVQKGFNVICIYVVRPDFDNELGVNKYDVSEMPMDIEFDYVVKNDADLDALEVQAKLIAQSIKSKKGW